MSNVLTSVARCGLNQNSLARSNSAPLLGLFNHAAANTVLYTVAGLHTLKL